MQEGGTMKVRRFTKKEMILSSVRVPVSTAELWLAASAVEGVSRSEFLRTALRERVKRVLAGTAEDQSSGMSGATG